MSRVLMIFIDGIGLGTDDTSRNPFSALESTLGSGIKLYQTVYTQSKNAILVPTDACLGVQGLPQSATGQCTLLSGINASALLGYHLSAYPNKMLATCLAKHGIFTWCRDAGLSATFANGFRREYWQAVETGKRRHSATTLSVLGAQGRFRDEQDYLRGEAVYHDITGHTLRLMGRQVPLISPVEAGQRIAAIARKHDFTLFEYFLTDVIGHRQQWDSAIALLQELELFMQTILDNCNLDETAVLVVSDHGNFEDFSVRGHTTNPVLTLLFGPLARPLASRIHSLTDIVPAIQSVLIQNTINRQTAG